MNFPEKTRFNRRIPKQKFYERISITSTLKQQFIENIRLIYWQNKIAAETVNIPSGNAVTEIEIFLIHLKRRELDEAVLRQIDKEIPYHIVHLLEFEGKYQAWAAYKESTESSKSAFKVDHYYHTEWLTEEAIPLKIEGLTLDAVYENFVRQIAGNALSAEGNESLKVSVERDRRKQELRHQITALQKKIQKENQFNRQVEMNAHLKKLKKELEDI